MKIVSLFVLYFLRLCGTMNFWGNLRRYNHNVYSTARRLQKLQMKRTKRELDVGFLKKCLYNDVIPKFARWKTFKRFSTKMKYNEQRRVLRHTLNEGESKYRSLSRSVAFVEKSLRDMTSTMRFAIIISLIKLDEDSYKRKTMKVHNKKLLALVDEKKKSLDVIENPNNLVVNLTEHSLSSEELSVLKLGLNHSIALRPKEPHILAEVESLWEQILNKELLKNTSYTARAKTALRAFSFSLLDLDDSRFSNDAKQIKIIKKLRESFVILKPDKGNGVVLLNKLDYTNCMLSIFNDKSKFKEVNKDNSITSLNSLQCYLNTLEKRSELDSEEKSYMRPKSAVVARAHGLPKIHKKFDPLPKFRPIIDTTGTVYSHVGRFLSTLLQPLTLNEFSLKDSFDAAQRIKSIPKQLLEKGYKFVSFDVVSLFTNVPLDFTVKIILNRIYNDKLLRTNICKNTLKKLILDACRKTIFSFNDTLYQQVDGVSMGSSLGPVLANIVMTELESKIIKPLMNKDIIKFYCRYVDDTLVLIKPEHIDYVHDLINSFHDSLNFTVDNFNDSSVHFLDLLVLDNLDIDIYRKDTFTGQYIHFNSFTPWHYKVSWVRSLFFRCKSICSTDTLLKSQVRFISSLMAWNGFPLHVRKSLCNRFLKETTKSDRTSEEKPTLWLNIPYLGKNGQNLINNLEKKLSKCLSDFKLRVVLKTNKISMFCSNKDKIEKIKKANVVYLFTCPGCSQKYIGKTERNLITRLDEHARGHQDSAIHQHLGSCSYYNEYVKLFGLFYDKIDLCLHRYNTIKNNITILDVESHWLKLLFLEAYYIKHYNPELNTGVRASRELQLF